MVHPGAEPNLSKTSFQGVLSPHQATFPPAWHPCLLRIKLTQLASLDTSHSCLSLCASWSAS